MELRRHLDLTWRLILLTKTSSMPELRPAGTITPGTRPSVASQAGGNLIACDPASGIRHPASGITAGMTRGIYISSYGTGVYHTINGGATWTLNDCGRERSSMACRQRRWCI
jgi:hypothetical protein